MHLTKMGRKVSFSVDNDTALKKKLLGKRMDLVEGNSSKGNREADDSNEEEALMPIDEHTLQEHTHRKRVRTALPAYNHEYNRRITLNVGGIRFETLLSTLENCPDTRLGRLAEMHGDRDATEDYFFDRNPGVFQSVLDFYRTGELHYPLDVCGALVRRELKFWEIDEGTFSTCCVTNFSSFTDNAEILDDLRRNLEYKRDPFAYNPDSGCTKRIRLQIWQILNKPRSSLAAMVYAAILFAMVGTTLAVQCMETMESFLTERNLSAHCPWGEPANVTVLEYSQWLRWPDLGLAVFFTCEFVVKLLCAPVKTKYLKHPMTALDICAILPSYIVQGFYHDESNCIFAMHKRVLDFVMLLRILRVFRIFHILRHYGPFRVLLYSVKSTFNAMVMLIVFLGVSVMFFGSLIFYAERGEVGEGHHGDDHGFPDLPSGFWWAIITMTTVGYGDRLPRTAFGYAIGAVVAVSGLVILALVIPIISNAFTALYNFDVAMKNVHTHSKIRRRRKTLSVNNTMQLSRLKEQGSRAVRRSLKRKKRAITNKKIWFSSEEKDLNESQTSTCI